MLRIALFGTTTVERDGKVWDAAALGGIKERQILELLAVNLGTPVPKEVLAERLWDGSPPSAYVATLESYVCVLRRRLGLGTGSSSALATTRSKSYVLDPRQVQVDLADVRATLASLQPSELLRTLDRLPGELLASEPYACWAGQERERFAQSLATVCTLAARAALGGGHAEAGLRLARTAVEQGYFAESAHRELMRASWACGERAEALATYAELRARTLDELGIEPGPESQELYVAILRDGSEGRSRESDRLEVSTLVRLLRQALESAGRVDGPAEPGLVEVGRMLLARATSSRTVDQPAAAEVATAPVC